MSLPHQGHLLRILHNGSYLRVGSSTIRYSKCRVIAATSKSLEKMVQNREFMLDLYERLNGFVVKIPPLRERKADIPNLANFFLEQNYNKNKDTIVKYPKRSLDPKALEMLISLDWPGNIRQLENVVNRLCASPYVYEVIEKRHIEKLLSSSPYSEKMIMFVRQGLDEGKIGLDEILSDIECYALEYAMSKHDGHKEKATTFLKLGNQTTLSNRIKKEGVHESV